MVQFILMDIEGTTTSIDFVHKTLFPYASEHLAGFVRQHEDDARIKQELQVVKETIRQEQGIEADLETAIAELLNWIQQDRKHTALKALQGYLWKKGYETAQYKGHLYDDVLPSWRKWQTAGIDLGIYSSGSVAAQKLLFGYSEKGDVNSYLSAYFDTRVGHKREEVSYRNISKKLELVPKKVLFLSDVGEELDAAKAAGMRTIQLVRPGTQAVKNHRTAKDFFEVDFTAID